MEWAILWITLSVSGDRQMFIEYGYKTKAECAKAGLRERPAKMHEYSPDFISFVCRRISD